MKIDAKEISSLAVRDLISGLKRKELWWFFAMHDIKQRFRRSVLGPFWLTIGMAIMIASLGIVFGTLFKQSIREFLPYLATGIIFWSFLSAIITGSCNAFVASEGYIRNVAMPISAHYYRMFAQNLIILGHNMAAYLIIFFLFQDRLSLNYTLFIPGFGLLVANLLWIGLAVAILATRYRDITQIVANLIMVVFFVTPVFWSIEAFPSRPAFIEFNIFYHLLEIVRAPLLGNIPEQRSWLASIILLAVGMPFAIWLYRRTFARIPYWV